jgi:hypothetical protein
MGSRFRNEVINLSADPRYNGRSFENQMVPELSGLPGTNPLFNGVSAVRNQMYGNHLGQYLVIQGAETRRFGSALDDEYGKYTYSVKMPCDAVIIKTFDKYKPTVGSGFKLTPITSVLYQNFGTGELDLLHLPNHASYHQCFGFIYNKEKAFSKLSPGAHISEGSVILDSPNKKTMMLPGDEESFTQFGYGLNANVAFISYPGVAEDGLVISKSLQKRLAFTTLERRSVTWGNDEIPLNIFGDENNYKIFPDLGENLHDSGLLIALRKIREDLVMCNMDNKSLQEPVQGFDRTVYAGDKNCRVIDIKIYYSGRRLSEREMEGIYQQPIRYENATLAYTQEIVDKYNALRREANVGKNGPLVDLPMGFGLHSFLSSSHSILGRKGVTADGKKYERPIMTFKQDPIRGWRVEFVIERVVYPNKGFKLTGTHGDKGVIVKVLPDDEMGWDSDGNPIDIYSCGLATFNRMNPSRLYEQYFNAASRDVGIRVREIVTGKRVGEGEGRWYGKSLQVTKNTIHNYPKESIQQALDYLIEFYRIISPKTMYRTMTELYPKDQLVNHLVWVINHGVSIDRETSTPQEIADAVIELEEKFPPTLGPINFVRNGKVVTTVNNVLVGGVYLLLLEKTGEDWSAVASPKTNFLGVISKSTASEKFANPVKLSSTRALGEAEFRLLMACIGPHATVELHDRSANPASHNALTLSVLTADKPTAIWSAIDRNQIKLGNGNPSQFRRHIGFVSGWTVEYKHQP